MTIISSFFIKAKSSSCVMRVLFIASATVKIYLNILIVLHKSVNITIIVLQRKFSNEVATLTLDKTVCELFAGVGGFRIGLEKSDSSWKTVWVNQWEPSRVRQDAFECYCKHFGGYKDIYVNKDICTVDKSLIPDHNLLVGGFPCQDYSVAATGAQGIEGKKGILWWQIYDILKVKRPPFVLLENVDRLLKSPAKQRGRDFAVMLTSFWQFGYDVEWRVINAAEYGFVQRRRRVFIFAYRNDTNFRKTQSAGQPVDIINRTGFFSHTFPVKKTENAKECRLPSKSLLDVSDGFTFYFENAGVMTDGLIVSAKVEPFYNGKYEVLRDVMDRNVDSRFYLGENLDKWKYLKGAKREERVAKNGHRYFYSEGPIAFPDSVDKPARTILTSEASVNRSTHVVPDLDTKQLRLLTPDEADIIQGFPKGWTDTGMNERFRYFCMGNALVTGVVCKMGKTLNKIFSNQNL